MTLPKFVCNDCEEPLYYCKCDKMIFEDDIPSAEQALLYQIFGSYRGHLNTEHRFKPNGVTDNRKEWKLTNDRIGEFEDRGWSMRNPCDVFWLLRQTKKRENYR